MNDPAEPVCEMTVKEKEQRIKKAIEEAKQVSEELDNPSDTEISSKTIGDMKITLPAPIPGKPIFMPTQTCTPEVMDEDKDIVVPPQDVIRMYNEILNSPDANNILASVNKSSGNTTGSFDVTNLLGVQDVQKREQAISNAKKRLLNDDEFKKALATCRPQKKPTKKVKIMGFAPGWEQAFIDEKGNPIDNSDCEVWGLNELYKFFCQIPHAKATRWFEIHSRYSPSKNIPSHITWLQKAKIPVYMWEHYEDMPGSVAFPKDDLCKHFGWVDKNGTPIPFKYFSCQPAWMLAMAIYEGFEQIEMYGVNMATDGEFNKQRPSCEYWLGVIYGIYYANLHKDRKMGSPYLPEHCDLLTAPGGKLYGFDTDNKARLICKARINMMTGRFNKFQKENNQAMNALQKTQIAMAEQAGAKKAYEDVLKHIL